MVSTIFNSILFGELRPWIIDLTDERLFTDLLIQAPSFTEGQTGSLLSRIKGLLKITPLLADFSNDDLDRKDILKIEPLFDLFLPTPFNSASRFYLDLLRYESLRYLNNLDKGVRQCPADIDVRYLANTSIKDLNYIAKNANDELVHRGFSGIPDFKPETGLSMVANKDRISHLVLYSLKFYAIKLVFEIQELYHLHGIKVISYIDYFSNTFNENVPEGNWFQYSSFYFKHKINSYLHMQNPESSIGFTMLSDFRKLHYNNSGDVVNAIIALENYLFLQIYNLPSEHSDFDSLTNPDNSSTFFASVKETILKSINQKIYGYERFEIINENLDKLTFIDSAINQAKPQSAAAKLQQWLQIQAEAYKGNLSNAFAVIEPGDKHSLNKSQPLPILDKESIDELKTQAVEFLKHFSGHNIYKESIMTGVDFNRMIEYTLYLIEHDKLPSDIQKIPQIHLSTGHIRYTYYLMHHSFYGTREIKPVWIYFLKAVFSQFDGTEWSTLKTKFSAKPAKYDSDIRTLSSD